MTDDFLSDYVCSLSGRVPEPDEAAPSSDDELVDLPLGWSRITIESRVLNPYWQQVQAVKQMTKAQLLHQAKEQTEELDEEAKMLMETTINIQVDAQFSSLEATIPLYSVDQEVLFVAPTEDDEALKKEWGKVQAILGLDHEEEDEEEAE